MSQSLLLQPIGIVRTDFPDKFGIPHQGTIAASLPGTIILNPEYRKEGILRGLESYSHLWVIWCFSRSSGWSVTVRPPRLGGKKRLGVFATRSPNQPNSLGLTAVKISEVNEAGFTISILGADLADGTPLYDIKPYLPYCDSIPCALPGISAGPLPHLCVRIPEALQELIPADKRSVLISILQLDPRPACQHDPDRIYHMEYAGMDLSFQVHDNILEVTGIHACAETETGKEPHDF